MKINLLLLAIHRGASRRKIMPNIEEQIKNEQVLQIIKKLSFFEELVIYIEQNGCNDISIDQAIVTRDLFRKKLYDVI